MAAGHVFSFFSEERRVVDSEEHRHRRLVDSDDGKRLRLFCVADGVADFEALQTDYRADVATVHLLCAHVSHALKRMQLLDAGLLHRAVAVGDGHLHAVLECAAMYASDGDTSGV